ncbi:MAG: hypothetical protein AAFU49_10805 [Pseudomonadota bacterium]
MSETDSFIREVSEEVQQDRMFALWKRYGPYVIGGITAIVAASAALNWLAWQEREAAAARGGAFLSAEPTVEGRSALVEALEGPAVPVAQLQLAAIQADNGETDAAIETYRQVAATPGLKRAYSDLAALHAARLEAPTLAPDAAEALLAPMLEENAPYRLLALELRAVLRLNANNQDAARADLETILADPGLTRGLNARAQQLLAILGPEDESDDS